MCRGKVPILLILSYGLEEKAPFCGLQKFLWLPKNVRTLKYPYLQAPLEKHAIDTYKIIKIWTYIIIWKLIEEFMESCAPYQNNHHQLTAGLKLGWVIWVNRVTFCLGRVSLTRFRKYPGLTRILHCITCVDDGIGSGSVFLDSAQDVLNLVIDGHYNNLKRKKDTKGSRAWQQFRIMLVSRRPSAPFRVRHREIRIVFNLVNTEWRLKVFIVACCCLCKA